MFGTIKLNLNPEASELPISTLREACEGAIFTPDDPGYDEACLAWNLTIQQSPAVVLYARSEDDVQAAVRFACEHDLPIGVQATGHGMPRGCDDGMLINMSEMTAVAIDPERRTARLQGGAQWQHVLTPAGEHGLAGMCGSAPHVGVVGYTMGGGFGLMLRKYGLAIDAVESLRVVTADGDLRTADRDNNRDLFWAILGGGGTFGVVTEMEIRLFPEATVFGGTTYLPAELAEKALMTFVDWTRDLPEAVTASIALMNLPPIPLIPEPLRGKAVVAFTATVCAEAKIAEVLLLPMRSLGTPIIDTFTTLPFQECGLVFRDPENPLPNVGNGVMLRDLSKDAVRKLLAAVGPMDRMPTLKVEIRHLGGAMARVPHADTAIGSRRDAGFLLFFLGVLNPFATMDDMDAHAESSFAALEEEILCRGPLNWIGEAKVKATTIRAVFCDETHARLERTKAVVDPENRFRFSSIGIR